MSKTSWRRWLGRLTGAAAGATLAWMMPSVAASRAGGGAGDPPVRGVSKLEREAADAVRVRLISDSTGLVPGRSGRIALTFDIAPGWHLYWRNPGDSGLPISFEFELPRGVSVGRVYWPTPIRHLAPGDVLDYIYEKQVTLVFDVEVARDVPPSGRLTIAADVSWLVCREACVPGDRRVSISLPVATEATASEDGARFAEAGSRVPRRPAPGAQEPLKARWDGVDLVVDCPGAEEMVFFPYESDSAQPESLVQSGRVKGHSLRIRYPAGVRTASLVQAVVEVRRGGSSSFHELEIAPPAP